MSERLILPLEVEKCLEQCKQEKMREHNLEAAFPNPLLREDVLDLLDRFCTVVYYPLKGEENNGFHITDMPFGGEDRQSFVFINTAQTMEKQVFTAAHELGHIWKVDDYVIEHFDLEDTDETREMIINRFAAVLLIPETSFRASFNEETAKLGIENGKMPLVNILKLIVVLMSHFFVPMKAIVLRFLELGVMPNETAMLLLGERELSSDLIEEVIQELISEYGYIKFQKPSEKKWIEGLAELLDAAEKSKVVSIDKISHMRETFDLKPRSLSTVMDEEVSLTTQEGHDV